MSAPTPEQLAACGTEHGNQVALFAWMAAYQHVHPELMLCFAIPNGGERNKIVASRLKAEGAKAGVPDICLPVARGVYHALYIELKKNGGIVSKEQLSWKAKLEQQGNKVEVCFGWENAALVLWNYLDKGV